MPNGRQELLDRIKALQERLDNTLAEIRSFKLADVVEAAPSPLERMGATPSSIGHIETRDPESFLYERHQTPSVPAPGRPVEASQSRRDQARRQHIGTTGALGLANRLGQDFTTAAGAMPVQGSLWAAGHIPGPIGEIAGRGAEAIGERRSEMRQAREEVAPEFSTGENIANELSVVGGHLGMMALAPGGSTLLGTSRAQAAGAGLRPALTRIAQTGVAEAGRGAATEAALSIGEGADIEEINRRTQIGGAFGAAIGPVIGAAGEAVRLRNRIATAARKLEETNARIRQVREGTGVRHIDDATEITAPSSRSRAEYGEGIEVEANLAAAKRRSRQPSALERRADTRQGWVDADQGGAVAQTARQGRQSAQSRIQDARRARFAGGRQEAVVPRAERLAREEDVARRQGSVAAENAARLEAAQGGRRQVQREADDLVEEIGEVAVRGERRSELPAGLRGVFDRVNVQRGATGTAVIEPIAGAGVGAAAGGIQGGRDSDGNLWRDIAIGGLAGAGIVAGGRKVVGRIAAKRTAIRNAKLPEASRRIAAHIGTGEQASRFPSVAELYRNLVRSQKAVESAEHTLSGGRAVRSIDSPTVAAELSTGSARRAEGALTLGVPRWTPDGNIGFAGESLEDILAPLGGRVDDFERYEAAARTLEVGSGGRNIETGISLADAKFEVTNASPIVRKAHERAVEFRRGILEYWRDAGGISQEAYDAMIELGAHYVPLNRIFEGRDPILKAGRIGQVAQDVKGLFGSKRRVVGSLESTIDQTNRLIRNADQNRVGLRLVEMAEANPEAAAGLIMRVENPLPRVASGKSKLLQEGAARRGISMTDETAAELTAGLADLSRTENKTLTVADDIIRVWRNGKQEHWRVAPALAKGIRGMSPDKIGWLTRLMGAPASGLKTGVTLHPAFQAVNFVRDTLTAAIQSQYGKTLASRAVGGGIGGALGATIAPEGNKLEGAIAGGAAGAFTGIESFRGLYHSMKATWLGKASKEYNDFVLGGGGFSSYRGSRAKTIRQQRRALLPQSAARGLADRAGGAAVGATAGAVTGDEGDRLKRAGIGGVVGFATGVTHPVEALKRMAAPFEEAARMGEFLRARESGRNVMESVIASKKVSVDFQQMGASMGALSHMAAFLNPAVQSMDTMMRIAARPVTKTRSALREGATVGQAARVAAGEAASVYGTAMGAIAIPSMLLWAANKDDQQINDLRKTQSGLIYWFYRTPDGGIGKIPKPFVWGQLFGTGVESALDAFLQQDPDAARRFAEGVREQSVFQVLPTIAQITRDQWKNEDGFFGTPIVPPGLEGQVEPRLQSRPGTGTVARMIGDRYNLSPARLESIWQDISGTLGKDALKLFDRAVEKLTGVEDRGMPTLPKDNVLWGRFMARYPTTSVEPMQTFYDDHHEMSVFANSLAELKKTNPRGAIEMMRGREIDIALVPYYEAARQKIAELRADMEFIRQQPVSVMPKDEKQRIIDALTAGTIETARNVNATVRRIRQPGGTR